MFPGPPPVAFPLRRARCCYGQADSQKAGAQAGGATAPYRTWAIYRVRFVLAADLSADWPPFGDLSAHLNNLSILLHLATAESIAVALAYGAIVPAYLGKLARPRANKTAGAAASMACYLRMPSLRDSRHITSR